MGHRSCLVFSAEVQSAQRKTEGRRGPRQDGESLGKARVGEQLEVIYTEASSAGINHTLSTHPEQCQWRNATRFATQSVNLWPTTFDIKSSVRQLSNVQFWNSKMHTSVYADFDYYTFTIVQLYCDFEETEKTDCKTLRGAHIIWSNNIKMHFITSDSKIKLQLFSLGKSISLTLDWHFRKQKLHCACLGHVTARSYGLTHKSDILVT